MDWVVVGRGKEKKRRWKQKAKGRGRRERGRENGKGKDFEAHMVRVLKWIMSKQQRLRRDGQRSRNRIRRIQCQESLGEETVSKRVG